MGKKTGSLSLKFLSGAFDFCGTVIRLWKTISEILSLSSYTQSHSSHLKGWLVRTVWYSSVYMADFDLPFHITPYDTTISSKLSMPAGSWLLVSPL